jgi:hypothetical protein
MQRDEGFWSKEWYEGGSTYYLIDIDCFEALPMMPCTVMSKEFQSLKLQSNGTSEN